MIQLLVVVLGACVGFGGARVLRKPASTASAASVARSVGSAVGTRKDLDLPHLQRSVLSEMTRHVHVRDGRGQVPGRYRVRLHPDDNDTVQQAPGFFVQGLEQAMAAAGRDHGWDVPRRFAIDLVSDPSRSRGAPAVDVLDEPAPAPARAAAPAPSPAPRPAARPADRPPRLECDDGRPPHELVGTTTIGRGADRDVRIDDSRASRVHATIAPSLDGSVFTIIDQGSSNGTRLNDHALAPHTAAVLHDGDRIGIGPVVFVFRAGPPAPTPPGQGGRTADADQTHIQRYLAEQERRGLPEDPR